MHAPYRVQLRTLEYFEVAHSLCSKSDFNDLQKGTTPDEGFGGRFF